MVMKLLLTFTTKLMLSMAQLRSTAWRRNAEEASYMVELPVFHELHELHARRLGVCLTTLQEGRLRLQE